MQDSPIGIFDSGVGGTSIWKEIQKLLPNEDTLYLADSKNAPYGEKPKEEIVRLSRKNTEFLLRKKCKLIVVACNTATTNAITHLRENYDLPFIGIEPAIKPAALNSKSKTVGVLATKGTLASSLFHSTSENHAYGIQVMEQEGTGLVELIERGELQTAKTRDLLKKFLDPMLDKGIDYLVLGCSHYPYLIPLMEELLPPHVRIIDSGEAVARQTNAILLERNLLNAKSGPVRHQFLSNTDNTVLKNLLFNVDAEMEFSCLTF
ncbi:glutamate racemase [Ulvibacterium sp.]|uniref:glutamate racemase n=1 Tax=Ulvibacterium sp. TaxID=2665914 RepID=UPI0026349378|nr:glutamate racemase [Ulvibacterium sp.]